MGAGVAIANVPARTGRVGPVVRRGAALAVDLVAVGVLVTLAAWLLPRAVVLGPLDVATVPVVRRGWLVVETLVVLAVNAGYFTRAWAGRGATPGQWACRLELVDARGARVTPGRALVRWAVLLGPPSTASALGVWSPLGGTVAWLLVALWALALTVSTLRATDGRGLHDRLSGCRVRSRSGG